jgi:DNA-binding CsgD family transcriptional regulator
LDLHSFAYLAIPPAPDTAPELISTYSTFWTSHYLGQNYERIDPVIRRAASATEPFAWGHDVKTKILTPRQTEFFDEARQFGIAHGFTVPIHGSDGRFAAVTFATDQRRPRFRKSVEQNATALQLMAMYFHAHVQRSQSLGTVPCTLSCREHECLAWASKGKSAWEIGKILGISRRTAAFHLDNAKAKLGVHSITEAVAMFAAATAAL